MTNESPQRRKAWKDISAPSQKRAGGSAQLGGGYAVGKDEDR